MGDVRSLLSGVPLFGECTEEELAAVAAGARRRRYRRGECIFREGDPETGLCVVEWGWVKVRLASPWGKERILGFVGAGGVLGEASVLDGRSWPADVVAQQDSAVVFLAREVLGELLRHHPGAALRLLDLVDRRLRAANLQLRDDACLGVQGRLARALLDLRQDNLPEADGHASRLRLRQADLAQWVGATRESVNRWLGRFERGGAIRRSKDHITVLDRERLRRELDDG